MPLVLIAPPGHQNGTGLDHLQHVRQTLPDLQPATQMRSSFLGALPERMRVSVGADSRLPECTALIQINKWQEGVAHYVPPATSPTSWASGDVARASAPDVILAGLAAPNSALEAGGAPADPKTVSPLPNRVSAGSLEEGIKDAEGPPGPGSVDLADGGELPEGRRLHNPCRGEARVVDQETSRRLVEEQTFTHVATSRRDSDVRSNNPPATRM
ncbi:hypothetical protein BDK51DRAFT_49630 [Blyttiomyces helicus]|uniref:Uncharacterized protein n=1 Tax=Blyttiomyces helicus TaxID=388810 RepID=A0A4P9WKV5_9FUNG|nr:hypothetical protein BDK51DRAFT_49630 [Blyttiomyces helicus]|eukprot:RKO93639.1 hypothetical protein BDK51DRAFT_49630 [Blyttiomyces helicus]